MRVTLEIPDITIAAKAMNNATIALSEIVWAINLGCDVPKIFEPLRNVNEDDLNKRVSIMSHLTKQLEVIERKENNYD